MGAIDDLNGCRVLIVEDEVLVGFVLEDLLEIFGCVVVGNAATLAEACHLAEEAAFDVAILDVNIGTDPVFPLADALLARGIPVVFATGALAENLPERFRECPVLEKPYMRAGVEKILRRALSLTNEFSAGR